MNSQLEIDIDYNILNFATSSLESSIILLVLNNTEELSKSEIVLAASKYGTSLGISEDGLKYNIQFYLDQLSSLNLIEIRDGKYIITLKGREIYSLIDIPLNHVANILSNSDISSDFNKETSNLL